MPTYQSAYRPNCSCETTFVKLMNDLLWTMEHQNVSTGVDLSATFDMVDHNILLNVLENMFGVSDKVLEWFNTYPRPRSCKIKVEEDLSEEQVLTFLVPQGSAAGPTLYLCCASMMREEIWDSISIYRFADDH